MNEERDQHLILRTTQNTTATQRPMLLFVDDEERILRSLKMMFAAHYRVLTTTSGLDALEILRREKVHVLVSDQRMPIMSGIDLLRQARAVSPNTLRLLLTGYSDMEAIIGSINEGEVFRYINKPWKADELRQTIEEASAIAVGLESVSAATPETISSGGSRTILLIDHAPETTTALSALLADEFAGEFQLVCAGNLSEAIGLLETHEIAVVISEIHVGTEDMTPFLKTLKHYHPQIVTIVLTSFQDMRALTGLINQGQIYRFLPKPVRRGVTARSIRSGINRHNEIRTTPQLVHHHRVPRPEKEIQPGLFSRMRGMMQRMAESGQAR